VLEATNPRRTFGLSTTLSRHWLCDENTPKYLLMWLYGRGARLAKVPYACIANAYWSEYSTSLNYPVPELPLMRLLGVRLVERAFPLILPLAFYFNLRPYVQLQKAYGLPAPSCLRAADTNADYVLYPALPALAETTSICEPRLLRRRGDTQDDNVRTARSRL